MGKEPMSQEIKKSDPNQENFTDTVKDPEHFTKVDPLGKQTIVETTCEYTQKCQDISE